MTTRCRRRSKCRIERRQLHAKAESSFKQHRGRIGLPHQPRYVKSDQGRRSSPHEACRGSRRSISSAASNESHAVRSRGRIGAGRRKWRSARLAGSRTPSHAWIDGQPIAFASNEINIAQRRGATRLRFRKPATINTDTRIPIGSSVTAAQNTERARCRLKCVEHRWRRHQCSGSRNNAQDE